VLYALGLEIGRASLLSIGAEIARVSASAPFALRDMKDEPNSRPFVLAHDSLDKSSQTFPRTRSLECRAYSGGNTDQVRTHAELTRLSEVAIVVLKVAYLFVHRAPKTLYV
jgi:hypothetical protein